LAVANESSNDRPLVLVTLTGGGHHLQMYRLLEQLSESDFRFAYAYGHHSGNHAARRLPMPHPGPRYAMHYLGPTRKYPWRWITNALRGLWSIVEAVRLVRRLRPDVILTLGTAAAVPLLLAGRLVGAYGVFVESLTRVVNLSLTGKLLYHLRLPRRLYVQWAHLRTRYPRTVFAGMVL